MAHTPRPADAGISIGQILHGKYRVEEILGQGGMGVVVRCTHLALNEQVAVKMLRRDVMLDGEAVERFMREAQAAVKLRSEYVARVSDVGTFDNGVPYMVMEFLDGHDLGAHIDEQGCVPVQWATDMILQTAEALAEAHSIGIVHRDVKPTNLFVTWRPDGTSLIKVLDFGISKAPMGTDMQLTQTQSLLGTPAYMSPEQMRSARLVDARTDIWSLGTVMYELLEGRRPFEAESFSEMCVKVAVDPPAPMINTPPDLQQVVLKCLAKSPEQRYGSMAELGRDLIPYVRDPHQGAMLVERMQRMLGRRSAADWDTSGATRAHTPTPAPRRDKTAPVRMPAGGWQGNSDPAMRFPNTPPGGIVQDGVTHREPSAPARAPSELGTLRQRRRKGGAIWAMVALLGVGVGGVLYIVNGRSEPAKPVITEGAVQADKAIEPPAPPVPATDVVARPNDADKIEVIKTDDKVATRSPDKTDKTDKTPTDKRPPIKTISRSGKATKIVKPPIKEVVPEVVKPPDPPPVKKDPFSQPRPDKR